MNNILSSDIIFIDSEKKKIINVITIVDAIVFVFSEISKN